MYAQCPVCKTVFGVTAAHLRAAGGRVRCGACGEVFNGLDTLLDELPDAAVGPEPPELNDIEAQGLEPNTDNGLRFLPLEDEPEIEGETLTLGTEDAKPSVVTEVAEFEAEPEPDEADPVIDFSLPEPEESTATPAWDFEEPAGETDDDVAASAGEDLPMALRPEGGKKRGHRAWIAGSVFLVLLVAAQLLWFNNGWLADQLPAARPWLIETCQHLGCPLPVNVSTEGAERRAVRLLSRDVRYHPGLESTLLVNATLNNEGSQVEPFPVLELSLFDTNGGLIGIRRFEPGDYLHDSVDAGGGLEPGQPVHIVLEIAATANAAVSFEFRFL